MESKEKNMPQDYLESCGIKFFIIVSFFTFKLFYILDDDLGRSHIINLVYLSFALEKITCQCYN
jgi:hypothetical protein